MNEELLDLIGHTRNEKTSIEAYKILKQNRKKQLKYENKFLPMALVSVSDVKSKKITGIGGSVPSDLIVDNLGELFAIMFGVVTFKTTNLIKDRSGVFRIYRVSRSVSGNAWDSPFSMLFQVGQGSTTPARSDFNIETPFTNGGVEDIEKAVSTGAFNVGLGEAKTNVIFSPTTGAGSISETICSFLGQTEVSGQRQFIWARDLISPNVGFTTGQAIFLEYIFQL